MPVVSTTLCYPSPSHPTRGIFVQRRLAAIHQLRPLRVVAPTLWFPGCTPPAPAMEAVPADSPPVWRPRMFYLPGILKRLDSRWYARSFAGGLSAATADAAEVELIDAHFEWPDGVGAFRVAQSRRLPLICTLRGKLVSQTLHPAKRRQIREMLLGAEALIAVSASLAHLAGEVAGRPLDIHVIPNGIDTQLYRRTAAPSPSHRPDQMARDELGLNPAAKYVVSVGHMQRLKGFDRLIDVWPAVRRRAGDVRLVLIGGPAGEPSFERGLRGRMERSRLAVAHGCPAAPAAGDVILVGPLPPEKVAAWLNAADLFALVSRSEGWCNALAEALACGCPVVATDVGGNREQVRDPAYGLLVPADEPPTLREAMAEALVKALAHPWDRDLIAREISRRNWQQVARECVDVWDTVAVRRRG